MQKDALKRTMNYLFIIILILGMMNISCNITIHDRIKYKAGKYYFSDADMKFDYRPFNEVEYKYIEDHRQGYYVGIFNEKNDLVVFEDWHISKEDVKIEKYLSKEIIKGLIDNLSPALYYSIIKEKGVERPNKQIDIRAAEELNEYYRLTFDNEKLQIKQQKITKKREMVATNSYDEEGRLIMSDDRSDCCYIKYVYNEEGKLSEFVREIVKPWWSKEEYEEESYESYEIYESYKSYYFYHKNRKLKEEKTIYADGRVTHLFFDKKGEEIVK